MGSKISKGLLMTALVCGTVVWGGNDVSAQEKLEEFALDEYVVTATRYEKKAVDVAASVDVFDQERLQATGASNLYEALQFGTGLMVNQYGSGGSSMGNMTSKIAIRGNTNGTLVLVNGMPINLRGTYDLNDIPVENVERVEVVRGGGSVLYGSDATGGVINIITKKERQNFVKAAVGNFGQQEYVASVQADKLGLSYKYSKWGSVDNVGINKSNGKYDRDWKGPENNNFDLTYKFNENLSLMASHNESDYNYLTTLTKSTAMGFTPANDTRQEVKRNNVQLTYQDETFKATAYYVDRDREKFGNLLDDGGFYNHDDELSKNYGLDVQKSMEMKDATFLIGATYQSENYKSSEESQDYKYNNSDGGDYSIVKDPENGNDGYSTDSTNGNQSRDNYSIYMQYDKKLSEANSMIVSARESWTNNSPTGDEFDNFSGQVQFIHKLSDNESLYASAGQSFKMPTLYQNYRSQGADLEPQEGTHYEMGWKKDIDENRSLRVALFDYEIENNISAKVNEKKKRWEYSNENIKNTGIEVEYAMNADKGFGYNVSASYGNPKTQVIDKNDYDFGWQEDNNKFELKAGLTYRMDKWKAAMNAAYVSGRHGFKAKSAAMSTPASLTKFDAKAYLLTNLNVEYKAQKDMSFFATVNNIFDRDDVVFYSDSAEYYATPVNFLVGMKYSF